LETSVSTQSITLSDYKEIGPTIIQQIYPKERARVGGQVYNATQIIISAQLYIPVENDYSVSSSFNHLGSLTTIDGIQGQSGESKFHLTSGVHAVEIQYINEGCLDTEYFEKTFGSDAKPLNIYFAISKKSEKQTIKNYTRFDNPTEIVAMSKPYKYSDLYLHCPLETKSTKAFVSDKCKIGGCNGEICEDLSSESRMSICLFRDSFACYNTAKCEVQQNGECGWTQSAELLTCLEKNK